SRGEDAPLTAQLSVCKSSNGVVLVSPEAPHTPVKVFCADELKRFDCQILSHIRNYILYSYGECENKSDMYRQMFIRPAYSQFIDKELREFNIKAYQATPEEAKEFLRTLVRTEYEKGCLPSNIIPDY